MKIKALIQFIDKKENTTREVGDEFIVSKERFEEIIEKGGAHWVEEVMEEPSEEVTEEPNKDTNKKKRD